MIKNILTSIVLLLILGAFAVFITETNKSKEILTVFSPTRLGIDLDKNKTISNDEIFCIESIESFSLEPSVEFYNKYSTKFKLSKIDMINLGYLAQEFAAKTLQNQKVTIKTTNTVTNDCQYANIKINGLNYKKILKNSGFGIASGKLGNPDKFKENLKNSKNLNLVILNHHSNKYHTLDCKFGKLAHDTILIPQKQLPASAIPCKYCHNNQSKQTKIFKVRKNEQIINIPTLNAPATVASNGNLTLYYPNFTKFLKPNNKCSTAECKAFVNLLDNAKESIDIAIYGYENIPDITKALEKAKSRNVKIRFVYDENYDTNKTYYKGNHIIQNLAEEYRSDKNDSITLSNMLMHNKFIIFDKKTVFTGSMNFSATGTSGYDANTIAIINSSEIAELYEKEFEQMLSGKFHTKKTRQALSNKFQIGNSTVEVYFSPQDKSSIRIVELIKNAQHYIYIPTFLITHTEISNELIKAKKRGVDVRIIMDANNVYTRNTKHALLRNNNIPLKIENYAGKMHSKAMIIDDKYIIMGSMNFSNSGENKNDENLLVIKNEQLANNYKNFFLYLWQMIPDKYLKFNPKAESLDSIGSCSDGVDNNFNGKIDREDEACKP
ncbi:DUF1669 domain-containing protein [bacterium]|nr:DUF1669 domain-containing protein [bacterium]